MSMEMGTIEVLKEQILRDMHPKRFSNDTF